MVPMIGGMLAMLAIATVLLLLTSQLLSRRKAASEEVRALMQAHQWNRAVVKVLQSIQAIPPIWFDSPASRGLVARAIARNIELLELGIQAANSAEGNTSLVVEMGELRSMLLHISEAASLALASSNAGQPIHIDGWSDLWLIVYRKQRAIVSLLHDQAPN